MIARAISALLGICNHEFGVEPATTGTSAQDAGTGILNIPPELKLTSRKRENRI
jgi:hypothetical protein